jgi:1-acyl-sn-glycerol-3-phosphate acyltransferase
MTEHIDLQQQQKLLHDRGICVVIPTYNNAGTVRKVVEDCLRQCRDVIVVNDGCTDDTHEILSSISGITVVEYGRNRGKGHALKVGFRKALEMGFAYAITLDADGQHYTNDIHLFLEANLQHPGALIIGSRRLEGVDRSKGSNFANKFSNFWFWVQTGRKLTDTQTGYRFYPLRKLHGVSLLTSRYEAELELLVFASWHGVDIVPIPINVYYPPRGERVSHFRPGQDFARISILNTVLCFLAVVYGLPLRLFRSLMVVARTVYSLLFFLFFALVILTPVIWFYMKLSKHKEKARSNLHLIIYYAARFVMLRHGIPGTKFVCKKNTEVDLNQPRIIICNHQSHLDLMCQLVFTPKIVFLTNDWVWNNPLYGVLIRNAEYLPVSKGLENIMPQLQSLIERGYSIAVFPEGTRSKDCRIGRFHQGAFWLAQQFNLEILPMYLYGPGKILPKGTYHLRKGTFYIEVDNPLTQADLSAMGDIKQQASQMRKRYQLKYQEIDNELSKA